MTRFRAQVKRIFDESKITVVGSPTITSDGVASGFSSSNYVNTDYAWTPSNNIWEIRIKCKTPSTLPSPNPAILMGSSTKSDKKVPRIGIQQNGKWIWSIPNDTGTAWQKEYWGTLDVAKLNTDYYFKMYFTGTAYKLDYSLDNKTWNNMASFQSTTPVYNLGAPIGLGGDLITYTWTGSIDLTGFKIYVNGELVYSPTRPITFLEKRKLKKKWFTIIGNPTITANKLASGFSNKNYIETFNSSLLANPFELYFGFTATNVNNRQTIFGMQTGYGFNIGIEGGKMMFGASSNGASLDIASNLTSSLTINANTKYLGRLKWTGTIYTLSLYINNAWVDYITVNNSNAILGGKTVNVGLINNVYPYVNGSIDLKDIKLVVNSIPVFDGSVDTYEYDPSKFTVVGSPNITEDGVASGFSASSYVLSSIAINATTIRVTGSCVYKSGKSEQYVYKLEGVIDSTMTTNLNLILTRTGFIFDGYINGTWTRFISKAIKTFDDGDIIDFDINFEQNTQSYSFVVDGEVYSYNTSLVLSNFKGDKLVVSASEENYCFLGSIDLKQFSITVDGKEVFTGAKEQYYAMKGGM